MASTAGDQQPASPSDKSSGSSSRRHRWWRVLKVAVTLLILAAVGWEFARTLRQPQLWEQSLTLRPGWLVASAVLYLVGGGFSAAFWFWLLRSVGQHPSPLAAVRAYYVGQLGRYVPGKVWGLFMRATLVTGPGVQTGPAALTAVYEALITPAAGGLVGGVLFLVLGLGNALADWEAVGALVLVGLLIVPRVFNALVRRIAAPFRPGHSAPLPRVPWPALVGGLALAACGWAFQGASLWAVMHGLLPDPQVWGAIAWVHCTAYVGLAYVLGFIMVFLPSGLGVREFFLQKWLARALAARVGPPEAAALAVVAALLLRLLWLAGEVVMAGLVYWLPGQKKSSEYHAQADPEPSGCALHSHQSDPA